MKQILIACTLLLFISCSKDDNGNSTDDMNDSNQFAQLETDIQNGLWEVSSFIDRGEDKTFDYEGYEFEFQADGVVIGQTDLFSETGTWDYDNSNISDNGELLKLQFNGTEPFPDLSEDWEIVAASTTSFSLEFDTIDVNKTLQFTKL